MGMNYAIKGRMIAAQKNAEKLRKRVTKLVEQGLSQRKICDELNAKGIKTSRGNEWYVSSLATLLARLDLSTKRSK